MKSFDCAFSVDVNPAKQKCSCAELEAKLGLKPLFTEELGWDGISAGFNDNLPGNLYNDTGTMFWFMKFNNVSWHHRQIDHDYLDVIPITYQYLWDMFVLGHPPTTLKSNNEDHSGQTGKALDLSKFYSYNF